MQFDDILFLLVIGFGIISSLFGAKAKKKNAPPRPRPKQAAERSRASTDPKEAGPDRRKQVLSEMERIFQELQGGKPQAPTLPSRPKVQPPRPERKPKPMRIPVPAVAEDSEARSRETLVPAGGESHVRFHEQYITEFVDTKTEVPVARAVSYLNAKRLREAILLQEILGPPKSLRDF